MNRFKLAGPLSPDLSVGTINDQQILHVHTEQCEAMVALQGAHLFKFQPKGSKNVVWLSDDALFEPGKAIRGGIPVCWPWFGTIGSPSHGFARNSVWTLEDHQRVGENVVLTLSLSSNDDTRAIWPHEFRAEMIFTLGNALHVELKLHNTGSEPWYWSGALHTYFEVGNAAETQITGMGEHYLDSLQNDTPVESREPLMVNQSIDRVYNQPDDTVLIHDKDNARTITVSNSGHNAVVIWNPWDEISRGMVDMTDNGYQTMVCVESTQFAPDLASGKVLDAGETVSLTTHISV